jgi:hypothetical protein
MRFEAENSELLAAYENTMKEGVAEILAELEKA